MATRFYLPAHTGTAADFNTLAFDDFWAAVAGTHYHLETSTSKTSTSQAYANDSTATSPYTDRQFISGQMDPHDFTTSETVQAIVRVIADVADSAYLSMVIRVVSSDGGTVRGVLFEGNGPTAISATAWTNRGLAASGAAVNIQNNVSMQSGDRIAIEVGVYGASSTGAYPYFGDGAASDCAANETGTDANNPWVEFSATLYAYGESPAEGNIVMNII